MVALPDRHFGNFKIDSRWYVREVFYWYDGPILFTCAYNHPSMGTIYMLGQAVDMDGNYMFVTLSRTQCFNVEHGLTTIRQAMKFPKGPSLVFAPFSDIRIHTKFMLTKNFADVESWNPLFFEDLVEKNWLFRGGYDWDYYRKRPRLDFSGRNVKSRKRIKRFYKQSMKTARQMLQHQQKAVDLLHDITMADFDLPANMGKTG